MNLLYLKYYGYAPLSTERALTPSAAARGRLSLLAQGAISPIVRGSNLPNQAEARVYHPGANASLNIFLQILLRAAHSYHR